MRRISLFHDFGGVGERFTGIATTSKILKSNKQMVERVARAKLVAINYILNPANKKSVLQTMAKNLKVANPERIKATYLDIVDGLPRSICPRWWFSGLWKTLAQLPLHHQHDGQSRDGELLFFPERG